MVFPPRMNSLFFRSYLYIRKNFCKKWKYFKGILKNWSLVKKLEY